VALPQWDPVPPSPRARMRVLLARTGRVAACALGTAAIGAILLAASPRAPQTLKQHLPWRTSLDAPVFVGAGEVRLWPDGDIAYYNAARDQAWALARAVEAWNESGVHVRFHAVPRDRAQLVVEYIEDRRCDHAEASLGRVREARVHIFVLDPARPECNRYDAAQALAHELGHVLGLDHQEQGCATMNPAGSLRGPEHCEPTPPSTWRCRLLEPADVRRAVELYGGTVRPLAGRRSCPLV
jgi:hypothetical protein